MDPEEWLDSIDPKATPADKTHDLAAVAYASDLVDQARASLQSAVDAARANGRTWAEIGLRLGVSRQAAQERFGRSASA